MRMNTNVSNFAKKNMMTIALVIVIIFFSIMTHGSILIPQNINNLISQNAYVFVLATGMLLCILTGGNDTVRYICTSLKPKCQKCPFDEICPKLLENSKLGK